MHHAKALPPKGGLEPSGGTVLPTGRGVRAELLHLMGSVHSTLRAVRTSLVLLVGNLLH